MLDLSLAVVSTGWSGQLPLVGKLKYSKDTGGKVGVTETNGRASWLGSATVTMCHLGQVILSP